MLSSEFWAYLAGRIDADGSIGCYRNGNWINVRCDLYSNHLEFLERIQAYLGGWISKNNTTWQWCVGSGSAEPILEGILPYLRTKKEQAELALKCRGHKKKTVEEVVWYVEESKRLNGRYRAGKTG